MNKQNEQTPLKGNLDKKETVIYFDDEQKVTSPEDVTEQAIVSIEQQEIEDHDAPNKKESNISSRRWLWIALSIFASAVLCILSYGGWQLYSYYYRIGVPISTSPKENVAKLSMR